MEVDYFQEINKRNLESKIIILFQFCIVLQEN